MYITLVSNATFVYCIKFSSQKKCLVNGIEIVNLYNIYTHFVKTISNPRKSSIVIQITTYLSVHYRNVPNQRNSQ